MPLASRAAGGLLGPPTSAPILGVIKSRTSAPRLSRLPGRPPPALALNPGGAQQEVPLSGSLKKAKRVSRACCFGRKLFLLLQNVGYPHADCAFAGWASLLGASPRAWWGAPGLGHKPVRTQASPHGPKLHHRCGRAAGSRRAPGLGAPSAVTALLAWPACQLGRATGAQTPAALGPRGLSRQLWHRVFYLYSSCSPWGGSRAFLSVLSRKEICAQSNLAPRPEHYFKFLFKMYLSQ